MLAFISQCVIFSCGLVALFLIGRSIRVGYVIGLFAQPFWWYDTYKNEQWGVFFLSLFFTFVYAEGFWRTYLKAKLVNVPFHLQVGDVIHVTFQSVIGLSNFKVMREGKVVMETIAPVGNSIQASAMVNIVTDCYSLGTNITVENGTSAHYVVVKKR